MCLGVHGSQRYTVPLGLESQAIVNHLTYRWEVVLQETVAAWTDWMSLRGIVEMKELSGTVPGDWSPQPSDPPLSGCFRQVPWTLLPAGGARNPRNLV